MLGLAGDVGDEFEVAVVVQDREFSRLCDRGNQRIDERQCAVLASPCQRRLDVQGAAMISVRDHERGE